MKNPDVENIQMITNHLPNKFSFCLVAIRIKNFI